MALIEVKGLAKNRPFHPTRGGDCVRWSERSWEIYYY